MIETLVENGEATDETVFELSDYPLSAAVLRDQVPIQTLAGDPESDPHEVTLLLNLGERSVLMVPVVSRGREHRDHRGLPARRARLDPGRGQPGPRDREPVRLRDPDALGSRGAAREGRAHAVGLERAPGAELAPHRLRATPHLDHLGAALVHVADDHLALDPLHRRAARAPPRPSPAAAAWPKLWATLIRKCHSAFE